MVNSDAVDGSEAYPIEVRTSTNFVYPMNWIGVVLITIGIVGMIGCIFLGASIANVHDTLSDGTVLGSSHFVWQVALPYWVAGFISGFVFIGFGEIINLLNKIRIRLDVNAELHKKGH